MEKSNYLKDNKDLMKEYNYEKNEDIDINEIASGSNKKIWWKCDKGHEWKAQIASRSHGIGCPYCSNQKVLSGYNDLATQDPELAKMWNYDKNKLPPSKVLYGGKSKHWWKCKKSHEWQRVIIPNKKITCPFCNMRQLLTGFNDLKTMNPDLAVEFDEEKNNILSSQVLYSLGSVRKKYWWKCKRNHSYSTTIRNRAVLNLGCPYCSNQRTLTGFNDILSHEEYALEWNYEKNKNIDPSKINYHSIKEYWWKCKKGHEWKMSPYGKKGCPICNKEKRTSLPEKIIYYYIKKYFESALDNYSPKGFGQKNIDIYIPNKKVGIEYDGGYYHGNASNDIIKDKLCRNMNIRLYRVREKTCPVLNSSSICIVIKNNDYDELKKAISYILDDLGIKNYSINISSDLDKIYDLVDYSEKQNSLQQKYPELLTEWDYIKNGKLTPDLVGSKSTKIVWWKCEKGHSYQSRVEDKTHKGNGCPICANRRVQRGFNDLETCNPKLASEWNYEKNKGLIPSQIVYGGCKKYWWKCKKGHEWETSIRVRIRGTNCPYCLNKKLLKGYNDLLTTNPKLASEWNYEKNKDLKPFDVFSGSGKKVWWKCENGHEWETSPNNRSRGQGCPKCTKKN